MMREGRKSVGSVGGRAGGRAGRREGLRRTAMVGGRVTETGVGRRTKDWTRSRERTRWEWTTMLSEHLACPERMDEGGRAVLRKDVRGKKIGNMVLVVR